MTTNDYIQGLLAGLKMVAENVQLRANVLPHNGHTQEVRAGQALELEAVAQHLNQIRESYKQLIKEHNDKVKSTSSK